jgi:hypothetical protein
MGHALTNKHKHHHTPKQQKKHTYTYIYIFSLTHANTTQVWRRGGTEINENDLFDRRFDVQRTNLRNNLLETIPWLRKLLRDINWPDVRSYVHVHI